MNNTQLAHAWAAQQKTSGEGSSFYFEGPTIYSYGPHFPIGTFTDRTASDGRRIVLMTTRGYSVTTARHIQLARMALYGLGVRVINCEFPGNAGNPDNLRSMERDYNAAVNKAARARSNSARYIRDAEAIAADAAEYAQAYNLPPLALPPIDDATLERARVAQRAETAATKRRNAERAAARERHYLETAAEWRAGSAAAELWQHADKPTMLRLAADGSHVETSRGATVTLRTARNLWRILRAVRGQDDATRAAAVERIGNVDGFRMREIRADGTAIIGCHTLTAGECDAFAAAQGWTA